MTETKRNREPTKKRPRTNEEKTINILLGQEHDLSAFASTDATRYVLNSIHYNAKNGVVEATNGRIAVWHPVKVDNGEFPKVSKTGSPPPIDAIIPIEPFQKGMKNLPKKSALPILAFAKLDADAGVGMTPKPTATLSTFDLDTEQAVTAKLIEGGYPNLDSIKPKGEPQFQVTLSHVYLGAICAYGKKNGKGEEVTLVFYDEGLNRHAGHVKNLLDVLDKTKPALDPDQSAQVKAAAETVKGDEKRGKEPINCISGMGIQVKTESGTMEGVLMPMRLT